MESICRSTKLLAWLALGTVFWLTSTQAQTLNVTLLGTGDPIPRTDRFGPSTLVEAGEHRMLFDAGRGTAQRLGQLGISLGDIDELFITHFHHDHLIGITDVWMTGWLPNPFGRRSSPWRVWGPTGTQSILEGLRQAMDPNIQIRIIDEQLPPAGAEFDVTEFSQDGVIFDEDGIVVTAFAVNHGEHIKPAYGYRIDYADRSVVISGDTKFDENLIRASEGVDVLIHELAAANDEILQFDPRMQLILDHHTSPEEAGIVFARATPKLAVYTHYTLLSAPNAPEVTVEEVLERTRVNYAGPLQAGDDLMRFEIGDTVNVIPFDP
ncbi:MAG: MBL fold metallo-hydrolase [Candidatus Rariloculaceae bacterium]